MTSTHATTRTVVLTPSQRVVYDVLRALKPGEELHNRGVAEEAGLSESWTCETLRALERLGLATRRKAKSRSRAHTHYVMWRLKR